MSQAFLKVKKGLSFPPQTSYPADPQESDIIYRGDLGQTQIYTAGQWTNLVASGAGGVIQITLVESTLTTLPTGANVNIDNIAVANNNLVLFTNLSSGGNEVYKVSGVGTALVWTAQSLFNASVTPTSGAFLYVQTGDAYGLTMLAFNGTVWGPFLPSESFYTLGENVTANDLVYISVGNAAGDTGRNAGMIYRILPTNRWRCSPIGFVKKAQNSGNLAKVFNAGVMTVSAAAAGAVGLDAYATSYNTFTQYPIVESSTWISFNVPVGKFISTTKIQYNLLPALRVERVNYVITPSNTAISIGDLGTLLAISDSLNGIVIDYTLKVTNGSAVKLKQHGRFEAFYNVDTTTWFWSQTFIGDNCLVTLTVDPATNSLFATAPTASVASGTIVLSLPKPTQIV